MPDEIKIKDIIKVYSINDMLDYQEGCVVSRTLIDKNEGTMSLFSLDKGQSLSKHTAPFDALVYIFDG